MHQSSEINETSNLLLVDQYQIDLTESEKNITLPSSSQHYTIFSTASSSPVKNQTIWSLMTQHSESTRKQFLKLHIIQNHPTTVSIIYINGIIKCDQKSNFAN